MSHRKLTTADFNDFVDGYLTAALWSSNDNADESGGEPLDANYTIHDIAPSSLRAMKNDCAKFWRKNKRMLLAYLLNVRYSHGEGSQMELAGHDFWLSANGHGAGFFDRDRVPKPVRDHLQEASRKFASDLYVGDDGQIYVSPERK